MSGAGERAGEKAELRRALRARLGEMSREERRGKSAAAVGHLVASPVWAGARCVLAYLAMASEVDLDAVFAADGKRVAAPRSDWETGAMVAAELGDVGEAVEVRPGLREPGKTARPIGVEELDLALVPGLGFDRAGGRLGRGGGFYDRFLATLPGRTVTVGVVYEAQLIDRVPVEGHDVGVRMLLTEEGLRGVAS